MASLSLASVVLVLAVFTGHQLTPTIVSASVFEHFSQALDAMGSEFGDFLGAPLVRAKRSDAGENDLESPNPSEIQYDDKDKVEYVNDTSKMSVNDLYCNVGLVLVKLQDLVKTFKGDNYSGQTKQILQTLLSFAKKIQGQLASTHLAD